MLRSFLPAFAAAFLTLAGPLAAQTPPEEAGSPDSSFGEAGLSRPMLTSLYGASHISRMLVQPDGKILISGGINAGHYDLPLIARLNADGSVDTGFGTDGKAANLPVHAGAARFMHLLADGRILVAGNYLSNIYVFRLNADGTVDAGFEMAELPTDHTTELKGFSAQSDGRCLLLCNVTGAYKIGVFRLNTDGSWDTSFGEEGLQFARLGLDSPNSAESLLVMPDDRIIVGYGTAVGYPWKPYSEIAFYPFLANGRLDFTFRDQRRITPRINQSETAKERLKQMVLDGANNILALAEVEGEENNLVVARITPKGTYDPAWNGNGFLQMRLGDGARPVSIQALAGDRVLVLAQTAAGGSLLARFDWEGRLDTAFGDEGLLSVPFNTAGVSAVGVLRTGGQLLLAGNAPAVGTPTLSGPNTGVLPAGPLLARLHAGSALPVPLVTLDSHSPDQGVVLNRTLDLTASATGPEGLMYTWYRNGLQVHRGTSPDYKVMPAMGVDEGTYVVEARYGSSFARSADIEVYVDQRAQISVRAEYPMFEGAYVNLEFAIVGRLPMQVKWFKNDVEFRTETLDGEPITVYDPARASLLFTEVAKTDAGTYHIEVTNADGTVTSSKSRLMVGDNPSITLGDVPGGYVVEHGGSLTLQPWYNTTVDYQPQWYKNGAAIRGATGRNLEIQNATWSDSAVYTVRIRTSLGNAVSPPMRVSVADGRGRTIRAVEGKKFSLAIPVKDQGITYEWYRDEAPLEDGEGITGSRSSSLKFDSVQADQAALYHCVLTQGGTQITAGPYYLEVINDLPEPAVVTLPAARVGLAYAADLPLPANAGMLDVRGLPPGLRYVPEEARITGMPVKPGRYKVTVVAVNPLGKSAAVQATLEVAAFLEARTGRFYGVLGGFGTESKGALDVTVTTTGTYTGKLSFTTLQGVSLTLPVRGTFNTQAVANPNQPEVIPAHLGEHALKHPKLPSDQVTPSLSLSLEDSSLKATLIIDRDTGAETSQILCQPCPWGAKSPLPAVAAGTFNIGWLGRAGGMPEGTGFGRATIKPAGSLTLVGRMVDDTAFTLSAPVTADLECKGFIALYAGRGAVTTGWSLALGVAGTEPDTETTDATLGGTLFWAKQLEDNGKQKILPYRFAGSLEVPAVAPYRKPDPTRPMVMNVPAEENNVWVDIMGLASPTMTLKANHSLEVAKETEPVAGLKSLSFAPATGLFTGRGVLEVTEEKYNPRTGLNAEVVVKRPYTVQGLVMYAPGHPKGYAAGYGLEPTIRWESGDQPQRRVAESRSVTINPIE